MHQSPSRCQIWAGAPGLGLLTTPLREAPEQPLSTPPVQIASPENMLPGPQAHPTSWPACPRQTLRRNHEATASSPLAQRAPPHVSAPLSRALPVVCCSRIWPSSQSQRQRRPTPSQSAPPSLTGRVLLLALAFSPEAAAAPREGGGSITPIPAQSAPLPLSRALPVVCCCWLWASCQKLRLGEGAAASLPWRPWQRRWCPSHPGR